MLHCGTTLQPDFNQRKNRESGAGVEAGAERGERREERGEREAGEWFPVPFFLSYYLSTLAMGPGDVARLRVWKFRV